MSTENTKVDLVAFQKRLNLNLENATADSESSSLVGFVSGGRNWLVALDCLREIESVPVSEKIHQIALSKPFVLGIANFKGFIYTLVDWQFFIGMGYAQLSQNARALLFHTRLETTTALIVSEVTGIISRKDVEEIDPAEFKGNKRWGSGLKSKDGKIWELINLEKLATDKEMLEIEAV